VTVATRCGRRRFRRGRATDGDATHDERHGRKRVTATADARRAPRPPQGAPVGGDCAGELRRSRRARARTRRRAARATNRRATAGGIVSSTTAIAAVVAAARDWFDRTRRHDAAISANPMKMTTGRTCTASLTRFSVVTSSCARSRSVASLAPAAPPSDEEGSTARSCSVASAGR
jgi:hypothetical protein